MIFGEALRIRHCGMAISPGALEYSLFPAFGALNTLEYFRNVGNRCSKCPGIFGTFGTDTPGTIENIPAPLQPTGISAVATLAAQGYWVLQ